MWTKRLMCYTLWHIRTLYPTAVECILFSNAQGIPELTICWIIRVSLVAQWERIHLPCRRPWFDSWVWKIWRRDRLPITVFLGFPCGSAGKESACNVGDLGSIPGLGRSPGEGNSYPLQYSGLENSMDCICIVHRVAKNWTWLSNFHFTFTGS